MADYQSGPIIMDFVPGVDGLVIRRPDLIPSGPTSALWSGWSREWAPIVNRRSRYLRTLGLTADPFATPVSEQEAWPGPSAGDDETVVFPPSQSEFPFPPFYAYVLDLPVFAHREEGRPVETLLASRLACVYGEPGSGKTALRLAVEAACRLSAEPTLAVTLELSDARTDLTDREHAAHFLAAFATDVFLQVLERFEERDAPPTPAQEQVLFQLFSHGGRPLRRLAERLVDAHSWDSYHGIAALWPAVHRSPLMYVSPAPDRLALVTRCLQWQGRPVVAQSGKEAIALVSQAARAWGFNQVKLLIDGIDSKGRSVDAMGGVLAPLLAWLPGLVEHRLDPILWLPPDCEPVVSGRLRNLHLSSLCYQSTMEWQDTTLRQLIARRFESASERRFAGLDSLAGDGIEGQLEALVLRSAAGSPRRLLTIISALIDAHVLRAPQDARVSRADWDAMRAAWSAEPPPPLPLE